LGFFHFLLLAVASDKVYQLLAHGRWFSPASSTTKTGRHDIAEILLKVALSTKNQINQSFFNTMIMVDYIDWKMTTFYETRHHLCSPIT
jgi:hypothetical protein